MRDKTVYTRFFRRVVLNLEHILSNKLMSARGHISNGVKISVGPR